MSGNQDSIRHLWQAIRPSISVLNSPLCNTLQPCRGFMRANLQPGEKQIIHILMEGENVDNLLAPEFQTTPSSGQLELEIAGIRKGLPQNIPCVLTQQEPAQ